MRKVAQAASAGFIKNNDFDSFWPRKEVKIDTPSWSQTSVELRNKILAKLKDKK